MKQKAFLTAFFLTISTFLFGQYFGAIGTQWYYSEHGGGTAPPNSEYLHLKSLADTAINDITTHKIERTYYKFSGDTVIFDPVYVYEQSDTVFLFNAIKSKFQTLYIFNASPGDTLTLDIPEPSGWTTDSTYRFVIDGIETVLIDGIPLKKYATIALDGVQFYLGGYFMDRIGGLDWFFPRATIIPEAGGPIRCYADSQIDTSFQPIACDFQLINSIDAKNADNQMHIFPNPFQDALTIQTELPIDHVELFDFTGRQVLTSSYVKLPLAHLNQGVYKLTIFLKSGHRLDRKIVKNDP